MSRLAVVTGIGVVSAAGHRSLEVAAASRSSSEGAGEGMPGGGCEIGEEAGILAGDSR